MIELMIVIVIIGILVSIGVSRYTPQIRSGELNGAKPYLMAIAAKLRITHTQYGDYLRDGYNAYAAGGAIGPNPPYSTFDERYLEETLGVDLKDAGDYCFMVREIDGNYISTSGNGGYFEVWAVLRDGQYVVSGNGGGDIVTVTSIGAACTTVAVGNNKLSSTGWIENADLEGRVVVLRYPPREGQDTVDSVRGVRLDWINGITKTDALL